MSGLSLLSDGTTSIGEKKHGKSQKENEITESQNDHFHSQVALNQNPQCSHSTKSQVDLVKSPILIEAQRQSSGFNQNSRGLTDMNMTP